MSPCFQTMIVYVLESRDKELVPLSDEIEFVKSFSFLLQTRFENKLFINIDVDAAKAEMIVPVSIQMLIENAVKHNEVSDAYPLKIDIRKNGDYIEVSNSLKAKTAKDASTNLGLKNLQQQFAFFSDMKIKIEKSATAFKVKLPIIKTAQA